VAMGFHSLLDFNWHIPANALLGTTVLALTCACANLPRRQIAEPAQEKKRKRRGRTRRLGAALLALLGLLSALWLASGALRTAVADLSYPQQVTQQPQHWIYRVEPAVALQRLRQALAWTPDNPWYWQRLATLEAEAALPLLEARELMDEGWLSTVSQLQRAAAAYERARQLQPTEPYTQLGWLYVAQALADLHPPALRHDAKDLAARVSHIATLAPSNPHVQYHLGYLILTGDTLRPADVSPLPFFQHALRLDASYDRHVLRAYLSQLSEPEALSRFALALPNTPQAHLKAAQLLEPSRWPYARLYYRSALVLSGSDPALLKAYGHALQRHEEHAAAQEIWTRLLAATPDDAAAYLGLAAALHGLGAHEGEVQTLQQLVRRFPRQPDYHARLAQAYIQRGHTAAAEAAWTRVTELQPHATQGYVGLARLYASRGDGAAAIRMMQRVVGLAPDNPGYQQALARLYEQSGNRALARQVYQRLAVRQPTEAYPFYKLGEYLWQEGDGLRALAYYRRAVQLQPDHAGFRRALERALKQGAK
jgi:tetratricopeptide (TPR) repeat protein